MGRPKKAEGIPTKERILRRAVELFAVKGYDAVSVREITHGLGLNEASLYNHYVSKEELLLDIFKRFEQQLTTPPSQEAEQLLQQPRNVEELIRYLQEGGRAFFARQGRETQLIWRILMISQYGQPRARDQVKKAILDLPRQHFGGILAKMLAEGVLPAGCDCESVGRIIAAVYIEYSLRAILEASWGETDPRALADLDRDLELVVRGIGA